MNNDLGKTTSFYELMSNIPLSIEIPIIQRDYAQGRNSSIDIRTTFLKSIKKHLDNNTPLNLDFVYGSIENNKFIPIDGQQRLTTLFLMHWYLAWSSGKIEHFRSYLGAGLSRFSYKTRISSQDFCDLIVTKDIAQDDLKVSELIKDQHWFYLNWKFDPTITGMLNTLDTISELFDKADVYYSKLIETSPSLLTFEYIELKNFGLSDHIYIKMNSRGKPLTEFENFKANVEQIFENYDKINSTGHTNWISSNIDGDWTDLFWTFREDKSELTDSLFMNFLRASLTNYYVIHTEVDPAELKQLLDSKTKFDYFLIESIGLNNHDALYDAFKHLDSLTNRENKMITLKTPINNEAIIDEAGLFNDIIKDKTTFSYASRIQHYAICAYLVNEKDIKKLNTWIRVIRNFSENSRFEDAEDFKKGLRTTHQLLEHSENILDYIKNSRTSDFVGFSNYQSKEEITKAYLILERPELKSEIEAFENRPYLKGQIGFALKFSNLFLDNDEHNHDNSYLEITNAKLEKFRVYQNKFDALFAENGIRAFDRFLFQRALLSLGDYTLRQNRNDSFLVNGNDRDISWKRFLRHENIEFLKELFDQIDTNNVESSLQNLISSFSEKDWRYYFVKYPKMIGCLGKNKYIRYYSDKNILLLEKTQTNGMHREYYSFAIKCDLETKGYSVGYVPNAYEEVGSKYIDSINNMPIQIYYYPDGDDEGYWLESYDKIFENDQYHLKTHDEVIDLVLSKIPLSN